MTARRQSGQGQFPHGDVGTAGRRRSGGTAGGEKAIRRSTDRVALCTGQTEKLEIGVGDIAFVWYEEATHGTYPAGVDTVT